MLKKIFKFAKGYVIIEVSGRNKERFVSDCVSNWIDIFNVIPSQRGLYASVAMSDFKFLRPFVRRHKVKVKIISRHGIPHFTRKYRHRYAFCFMSVAICIFFCIIPHYIWCVEIDGIYYADREQVFKILHEHGVYIGAKKNGIDDLGEIKNSIIFGVDEINWAWLYVSGGKATLKVQERNFPTLAEDETTPTDIIASADGFVKKADILKGERRVNEGMSVCKGDKLVSGKVAVFRDGQPEKYMYVNSEAVIIADTIRKEKGVFSAKETLRIRTGENKKRIELRWRNKKLKLYRDLSCGYNEYDVQTVNHDIELPFFGYIGLSVILNDVYEVNITTHMLKKEEVLERAREALEEKICRRLGTGAIREKQEITYNAIGDNYEVVLQMHLKENIGMEVPAEE